MGQRGPEPPSCAFLRRRRQRHCCQKRVTRDISRFPGCRGEISAPRTTHLRPPCPTRELRRANPSQQHQLRAHRPRLAEAMRAKILPALAGCRHRNGPCGRHLSRRWRFLEPLPRRHALDANPGACSSHHPRHCPHLHFLARPLPLPPPRRRRHRRRPPPALPPAAGADASAHATSHPRTASPAAPPPSRPAPRLSVSDAKLIPLTALSRRTGCWRRARAARSASHRRR